MLCDWLLGCSSSCLFGYMLACLYVHSMCLLVCVVVCFVGKVSVRLSDCLLDRLFVCLFTCLLDNHFVCILSVSYACVFMCLLVRLHVPSRMCD